MLQVRFLTCNKTVHLRHLPDQARNQKQTDLNGTGVGGLLVEETFFCPSSQNGKTSFSLDGKNCLHLTPVEQVVCVESKKPLPRLLDGHLVRAEEGAGIQHEED